MIERKFHVARVEKIQGQPDETYTMMYDGKPIEFTTEQEAKLMIDSLPYGTYLVKTLIRKVEEEVEGNGKECSTEQGTDSGNDT